MALQRKKTASNNPQMADIVAEAQKEDITPLHVQLPASLYKRIKLFAAESGKSLKDIVSEALDTQLQKKGK